MTSEKLIEKLNNYNKSFYSISDLEIITGQSRPVLRVVLNRLVKKNKIIRLQKNLYVLNYNINYELIAEQLNPESYISFETVLAQAGILSQIPYSLTLATTKRSKTITLGQQEIIYRKIKSSLYFGYFLDNQVKIAYPEKALLDLLYLILRGKSKANLEELDFTKINKESFKKYLAKYPKNVKKKCKELKII
ncbi:MAG: hypothetical protein ABIG60_04555 [Patescibacteria group bacterium]